MNNIYTTSWGLTVDLDKIIGVSEVKYGPNSNQRRIEIYCPFPIDASDYFQNNNKVDLWKEEIEREWKNYLNSFQKIVKDTVKKHDNGSN